MIALYINGIAVTLPNDFKVSLTEENPYITGSGTYTLDITLSLKDETNAKLYRHKNRINENTADIADRSAILLVNNRQIINGTEIVLGYTEDTVKIQIASGNADLNYQFSKEKKIWDLDWGTFSDVKPYKRQFSGNSYFRSSYFTAKYPDNDYCLPLFWNNVDGDYQNKSNQIRNRVKIIADLVAGTTNNWNIVSYDVLKKSPCPFLMYLFERYFEIRGFHLKENTLRNKPNACYLYLLNPTEGTNIGNMLPDWSEEEFINQFQNLFNVSILLDKDKNVIIHEYIPENLNIVELKDVLKSIELDLGSVEDNRTAKFRDYSNPSFEIPYSLQSLPESPWENRRISVFNIYRQAPYLNGLTPALLTADISWNNASDLNNKVVYRLGYNSRNEQMRYDTLNIPQKTNSFNNFDIWYVKRVDSYPLFDRSKESTLKIRIAPAEMQLITFSIAELDYENSVNHSYIDIYSFISYYAPICANPILQDPETPKDVIDVLTTDNPPQARTEYMQFAKFCLHSFPQLRFGQESQSYLTVNNIAFPFSRTNGFSEMEWLYRLNLNRFYGIVNVDYLNYDDFDVYNDILIPLHNSTSTNVKIDFSKKYEFYFLEQPIDPKNIFIINHKKFVCERIEYDVDKQGIVGSLMKGTFYPLLD
ncbi:MAG: hypothetical protein LBN27_02150 [Prevotellaceae bacterium]|jgi:hypothetical protein|nr:hypothetical protein [Prevotellaceae bacterium]